jgi:hypothetical protein
MKDNQKNSTNAAWITWEIQVRNRSMSKVLGVPLYEVLSKKSRWLKYPELLFETIKIIVNNKVKVLFVQNPSIVLSFLAIVLKPILNLTVIVDAHNSGIFPLEGKSKVLNFFARYICRRANYTIVSNSYLADFVTKWLGNPLVVPDPVPDFSHHKKNMSTRSKPYFLFICTWAADEPYDEIIKSARSLDDTIDIYVTGNYKKKLSTTQLAELPKNLTLLGFVSESDYINYFRGALAVIDLTTRDNCLVCGAYEAVALGVPALISDSRINREIFYKGFAYTGNSAPEITENILDVIENNKKLRTEINYFKDIYIADHTEKIDQIRRILISE